MGKTNYHCMVYFASFVVLFATVATQPPPYPYRNHPKRKFLSSVNCLVQGMVDSVQNIFNTLGNEKMAAHIDDGCSKTSYWNVTSQECKPCTVCEGKTVHHCRPYQDTVCEHVSKHEITKFVRCVKNAYWDVASQECKLCTVCEGEFPPSCKPCPKQFVAFVPNHDITEIPHLPCEHNTYWNATLQRCVDCTFCDGKWDIILRNCTSDQDKVCGYNYVSIDEREPASIMKPVNRCSGTSYYNVTLQQCLKCTVCKEITILPCQSHMDTVCFSLTDVRIRPEYEISKLAFSDLLASYQGAKFYVVGSGKDSQKFNIHRNNPGPCNSTFAYWNDNLQKCVNCSECYGAVVVPCQPRRDLVCGHWETGIFQLERLDRHESLILLIHALIEAADNAIENVERVTGQEEWRLIHADYSTCGICELCDYNSNAFWSESQGCCLNCSVCAEKTLHPCKPYRDTVCE